MVKLLNNANVLIEDKLQGALIETKKAKIAQNISKNIKIDGFRKGKVPLSIVENRFKDKILQDSEQELLNETITASLKANNIEPNQIIGNPIFLKYDKNDKEINFEVKLGIFPKLDIKDYEKFIPEVKVPEISKKDIENRINDIAKNYGDLIQVERALESKDIANIDFCGFIDGAEFDGGKAENYDLEIGSKSFIDGFEDKLIGMKNGESRNIELKFPQNYAQHLANKDVTFKVKLNKIQERQIAKIDDTLAQKVLNKEDSTLADLESQIKLELENEAKNKAINELKPALTDSLIANINFDLPDNIVEQELDIIFRNSLRGISEDELKELQNDSNKAKEKREEKRDEAAKSVKLTFIIDFIAKQDNIAVSDNEVYQMLYYESMMMGTNPKDLLENYQKNNMLPAIKMTILENKVLNKLLESKVNSKTESNKKVAPKDKSKDSQTESSKTLESNRQAKAESKKGE
ncbi:MAG: trigger factor [Helicobacteraceae bacterium]|nr:trigger factor [Helicobacteraceae bacterium]